MKFLNINFRDILKLYVNQVGITIFALMLYTACGAVGDFVLLSKLRTIVSVFSICFYFVLLYFVVWEIGAKDKIRIDGGKMQKSPAKGALLALFANIPNFILSILSLIFGWISISGGSNFFANAFGFLQLATMTHASMYMGLIQTMVYGFTTVDKVPIDSRYMTMPLLFVLLPIISILVCHIAYSLGNKDKKILSIFSSKNK